jgi:hypothetical protein
MDVEPRRITKREMKAKSQDKDKKKTFTFTIPERHLANKILILAAGTPIAIKPDWSDELFVKTQWCNFCGKCCIMSPNHELDWDLGYKEMEIEGHTEWVCSKLFEEKDAEGNIKRLCGAGPMTPQGCIVHNGVLLRNLPLPHPDCVLRYDKEYEIVDE